MVLLTEPEQIHEVLGTVIVQVEKSTLLSLNQQVRGCSPFPPAGSASFWPRALSHFFRKSPNEMNSSPRMPGKAWFSHTSLLGSNRKELTKFPLSINTFSSMPFSWRSPYHGSFRLEQCSEPSRSLESALNRPREAQRRRLLLKLLPLTATVSGVSLTNTSDSWDVGRIQTNSGNAIKQSAFNLPLEPQNSLKISRDFIVLGTWLKKKSMSGFKTKGMFLPGLNLKRERKKGS